MIDNVYDAHILIAKFYNLSVNNQTFLILLYEIPNQYFIISNHQIHLEPLAMSPDFRLVFACRPHAQSISFKL